MKKRKNEKDNFLLYVPQIIHEDYTVKDGVVTLYFKHDKAVQKFAAWFVKKNNTSDMVMDNNSSAVWLLIDGKRNIYEISKIMAEKLGDTEEVAIERLVMHMRYLKKRGWIKYI